MPAGRGFDTPGLQLLVGSTLLSGLVCALLMDASHLWGQLGFGQICVGYSFLSGIVGAAWHAAVFPHFLIMNVVV